MSYQVRHKDWGVFQGQFLGLSFWHSTSEQPEQGYYEFESKESANGFCALLKDVPPEMLSIEPFDETESNRLIAGN